MMQDKRDYNEMSVEDLIFLHQMKDVQIQKLNENIQQQQNELCSYKQKYICVKNILGQLVKSYEK